MISIISAIGKNNKIGIKNTLPWRLPADLKYFAKITSGKNVLMGKNTFLSILNATGRPLKNRKNLVLSNKETVFCGAEVLDSIDQVIKLSKTEDVFVAGGAMVYKQMLPFADKLYITEVNYDGPCDTYFPEINWVNWQLEKEEPHKKDNENEFDYNFKIFKRK